MSEQLTRERKELLRAAAIAQRKALATSDSHAWNCLIQGRVVQFPPYIRFQSVALYSPIQNEVDTAAIRDHALGAGKAVYYPRIRETCIELLQIGSAAAFGIGYLGILEPIGERRLLAPDLLELIVFVPGLVFDSQGNRVGRGAGWYDRLLNEIRGKATCVGLAYDFQIVEEVPVDSWDQRMDYVITERRVIDCGAARARPSLAS
jgi:5-formyltetrahydrofolate cyclo-ligase